MIKLSSDLYVYLKQYNFNSFLNFIFEKIDMYLNINKYK